MEGLGEHILNEYVIHTRGSEVGNHQCVRNGSYPHISHGTQAMNPPFQQMVEFFCHMAKSMHDPDGINFDKMREMGALEFEGTNDPTDAEQWIDCTQKMF